MVVISLVVIPRFRKIYLTEPTAGEFEIILKNKAALEDKSFTEHFVC